jgi:hypothetical protein
MRLNAPYSPRVDAPPAGLLICIVGNLVLWAPVIGIAAFLLLCLGVLRCPR